jgi:HD superfamily phosphohydrolase
MEYKKIIYDSIHGPMEIPEICIKIINTIEFQRLRDIYQLGSCYYVFPGASHKRFEHSIGVSYLAGELMRHLKDKQPELEISNRLTELVQIAGLCHDLGHGPFSHLFDNEFLKDYHSSENPNIHHENRSCIILENIVEKYKLQINKEEVEIIKDLINPIKFILKDKWVYQIIANCYNGIDVDKFDYISRDTKNIGLCYGFDYQRLLKLSRVINNHISYPIKTIFEVNNLFQTRYRLHREIYNHPVVKSIEYMINDILKFCEDELKISNKINDSNEFIKLNDNILSNIEFMSSENPNILKAKELIKRIKLRDLYKYLGEINNPNFDISSLNSIKEYIKENDSSYIFPYIEKEDDIIIEKLNLSYSFDPLEHVSFYDNDNLVKINKNEYINIINPIKERKTRFFTKNKKDKKNINEILKKFKKIYYDKL